MGVHSGKYGAVDGRGSVRNWTVTENRPAAKAVNSATLGGTARRPGVGNWSGNYGQHGTNPVSMPGDSIAFVGYGAPANDVSGAGQRYTGTALVQSVALTVNWAASAVASMVSNFAGSGALVIASGSQVTDGDPPALFSTCGMKVTYGDADTIITDLTQAVLTISSALQAFVNSSTGCWTGQRAGPIDWTLALTQQDDARVAEIDTGEEALFKLWISDTEYWELAYGHVEGYTNLSVDRETGAIIARTINIAMTTHLSDGTPGRIVLPGEATAWWNP